MKFLRRRISPLRPEVLRALGARDGWLIDTPDVLRVGFGRVVDIGRTRRRAGRRYERQRGAR